MATGYNYRYALLGVVGLVALVAIFAILRTPSTTLSRENVAGQATELPVTQSPSPIEIPPDPAPPEPACGSRDGQILSCHGANACCGGQCVQLPNCSGRPNGPVYTCGMRQMYCCGEALSLVACGGQLYGPPVAGDAQ